MTYAERTALALNRLNAYAAAKAEADKWRAVLRLAQASRAW